MIAIAEALHTLEFAELGDGNLKLTAAGRVFAESGTENRKRLFREHLIRFVPLAAHQAARQDRWSVYIAS